MYHKNYIFSIMQFFTHLNLPKKWNKKCNTLIILKLVIILIDIVIQAYLYFTD